MYDRALTNTVDTNSPVVRPIVQRGLINLESNSVKNILQFYFNLDRLRSISISDLLSYLTSGRNLSNQLQCSSNLKLSRGISDLTGPYTKLASTSFGTKQGGLTEDILSNLPAILQVGMSSQPKCSQLNYDYDYDQRKYDKMPNQEPNHDWRLWGTTSTTT